MRLESNERGGGASERGSCSLTAEKESTLVRNKSDMSVGMLAIMARRQRGWRLNEEFHGISKASTLKRSWVVMGREERHSGLVTENPRGLLH